MVTGDMKYMVTILKADASNSSLDLAFKGQVLNPPKKCGNCVVELPAGLTYSACPMLVSC